MILQILYHDKGMPRLTKTDRGDWIDLRAVAVQHQGTIHSLKDGPFNYQAGAHFLINLGISVQLPAGHEAHVAPRSSTFKYFGLLQTNTPGIIDETYCGSEDIWFQSVYALRPGTLHLYDRTSQFRIVEKMAPVRITEVAELGHDNRGGHGSSGKQ